MRATIWSENLKGRDHVEILDTYGKVVSEWILGNKVRKLGLD